MKMKILIQETIFHTFETRFVLYVKSSTSIYSKQPTHLFNVTELYSSRHCSLLLLMMLLLLSFSW